RTADARLLAGGTYIVWIPGFRAGRTMRRARFTGNPAQVRGGVYCAAEARYDGVMPRGIFMLSTGGPEVLREQPHDPGAPGPGRAGVRVAAAGVNFIDVYFRTGAYPAPTRFVLGLEGAGEVEAVGPDVRDLAAGDRVAWAAVPGSYADVVVAPVDRLVRVPK